MAWRNTLRPTAAPRIAQDPTLKNRAQLPLRLERPRHGLRVISLRTPSDMSQPIRHAVPCPRPAGPAAWWLLGAALLLAGPAALAGRPLVTDDAGVIGAGECEIEASAARQWRAGGHTQTAQLACGTPWQTQLAAGWGRARGDDAGASYTLSGKTSLRAPSSESTGWAIAYGISRVKPDGQGTQPGERTVRALATATQGDWLYHFNAGWGHEPGARHRAVWGLAAERPGAAGPVDLMGEVFGESRSRPWVQLAARWAAVPGSLWLDAAWAVHTGPGRARQFTLGLKASF